MTDVGLVEVLSDRLVVLRWGGWTRSPRDAIWSKGKTRKLTRCAVTERVIEVGEEAWRPVGNQDYRGKRIHDVLIEAMLADARERGVLGPG